MSSDFEQAKSRVCQSEGAHGHIRPLVSSWEQRKLGEMADRYKELVPTPRNGYVRMGVRSHAKGTFLTEVEPGQQIEEQELSKVKADNLVVNIVFAWEHAVAITSVDDAKALVSHRFPQFSFHDDMEPGFFRYAILDEAFRWHLWLASPSGAGRNKTLNVGTMLEYEFSVPKKAEQAKIAAFFDRLDDLITLHQRKCQYRGLYGYLSWEQRKLGDIAPVTMGQSPNGACYTDNPNDAVLVQGNADLKDGWVFPRVWTTEITKTAKAGNLIMSVRAPVGAMGKTAYDVVLGRGVAGIVGNEFLFQALSKKEAEGYWSTVSAGSTFDSINGDELRNTPVDYPRSKPEREAVGSCLSRIDCLITLHQRQSNGKAHNIIILSRTKNRQLDIAKSAVQGLETRGNSRKLLNEHPIQQRFLDIP